MAMKIEGMEDLEAKLKQLTDLEGKGTTRKAIQAGLIEASQPMVAAAKVKAPRGTTGRLQDGIKPSQRAPKGAKDAGRNTAKQTRVFVVSNDQKTSWFEFGTGVRSHKSGKSVGKIERQPFMRPAFEETKEEMLSNLGRIVSRVVGDAINNKNG